MKFEPHTITITGSDLTPENFGASAEVPNLVDFNGDGFLDIFHTRSGGTRYQKHGNALLISDGAWNTFRDASAAMGIQNLDGHNRQSSIADVNGDGWLDIAIGYDTIGRPDRFAPLNNTYGDWMDFFEERQPARWANWKPVVTFESQPGLTPQHPSKNTPYSADSVFGDFDFGDFGNDGWLDVVVLNRSESLDPRSFLFMDKGDGTFEVKPATFSGLHSSGISGEAADLDGDGLLDLLFAADPANSAGGKPVAPERFESKVYGNTGEHGAKQNHWLHLTFTGLKDAELIGARVELNANGRKQYRWIHSNHSYNSGGALDAHFGLGEATSAEVTVTLLDGRR